MIPEQYKQIISIHTPAKGVTLSISGDYKRVLISIHTPAKGVTCITAYSGSIYADFNPHSREGSDDNIKLLNNNPIISIHTPAKGVTFMYLSNTSEPNYFNPHSREGSDNTPNNYNYVIFYFNPHSREGSDFQTVFQILPMYQFQSTLPRRE